MKILIDLTSLDDNFTGIERYALNMTKAMLKQNQEDIFILVFKNKVFSEFLEWQNDGHVSMRILQGGNKLWFNQWKLPRYLNKTEADCFLFFAFPMPLLLRKKHVYGTIHDMGCWDCPGTMKKHMVWYFRLSYWWMSKRAEKVITISEFSKSRINEILHVPADKLIVVYCGISDNFIHAEKLEKQEDKKVREKYGLPKEYYLCLSTLEPRKNMMLLLNAYLELYQERKVATKLVLAGRKGWMIDELLEKADAQKNGQVVVTGFIEDKDLPAVYQMAKCFVFPSLYEGFGIPPIEAMSQGVPVISSDSSSLPEILGNAAWYFKSEDSAELKKVLLEFEHKELHQIDEKKKNGYIRTEKFSYVKEAERLRDIVKNRNKA